MHFVKFKTFQSVFAAIASTYAEIDASKFSAKGDETNVISTINQKNEIPETPVDAPKNKKNKRKDKNQKKSSKNDDKFIKKKNTQKSL